MKKRILFTIAIVFLANYALGQEEQATISADRPGMATGVGVLPFKSVQWETGVQWDYSNKTHSFTLPTTMLRVGVTSFAELRLQYDGTLSQGNTIADKWTYGVEPITLGTKIHIFDGWKAVPKVSFLANICIPATTEQYKTSHVAPSMYLLFENDATDWLNLCYNVGLEWNGGDATPATFLALCLGFGITDEFGAFVESYNYFTRYTPTTAVECNLDFGLTYLVHPAVQLDLYASFNCQDPANYANVGLGVAWMIR